MEESTANGRKWGRLEVSIAKFQHRIRQAQLETQTSDGRSQPASVLSRLALIHQVAKRFVLDEPRFQEPFSSEVSIEEITDPPMYDIDVEEGVVIIQYSYSASEPGKHA